MRKKPVVAAVFEPFLKVRFWFIYGPESVLIDRARSLFGEAIEPHGGAGRTVTAKVEGGLTVIIYLSDSLPISDPGVIGVLAHEAVHAACAVFEGVGVKALLGRSDGTDEYVAYYVEWIVRSALKALR